MLNQMIQLLQLTQLQLQEQQQLQIHQQQINNDAGAADETMDISTLDAQQ